MAKQAHALNGSRVVVAVTLLALHALVSVALVWIFIHLAYAFAASFEGAGPVTSYDELGKLGYSPALGMLGLASVGFADFVVLMVLVLYSPSTRSIAWVVPLVGIVASVLIVILALVGLEPPPPPYPGG